MCFPRLQYGVRIRTMRTGMYVLRQYDISWYMAVALKSGTWSSEHAFDYGIGQGPEQHMIIHLA